jgi:DNA polymerase-1
MFLTGKNNYRNEINEEYKGNRKDFVKPKWFSEIDNLLLDKFKAVKVENREADDALGITATHWKKIGLHPIICSLDKDLKQIAGTHWNFTKLELVEISEDEGNKYLWSQSLTGDMTDNIIGLKGIGPKKANKILGDSDYLLNTVKKYIEVYNDEAEALEQLYKVFKQVRIQQTEALPNESWLTINDFVDII